MSDGQKLFRNWYAPISTSRATYKQGICFQYADTCPEWNELLASEKLSALIELALPLLNLNLHDTLTCREVSKGVKKAVDNQLATFSERSKAFEFQPDKSIRRRNFNNVMGQISNTYNFTSYYRGEQSAQNFLSRFGEIRRTPYNPFLTRSFAIHSKFKEDKDCIATERILELFGHNLWHLTIYVNAINMDDDEDDDEFLEDRYEEWVAHHEAQNPLPTKKLARLLHLAPNLKTLSIATECREGAIIEELSLNELPELPHLTSLSFDDWMIEPSLPFVFLRRYGPQLIHLVDATNRSLLQLDELTVENLNNLLPKLTQLQIRRAFSTALPKLANVNWKLEELTIGTFYKWSTKDFVDIINNFGPSLAQLHITDRVHYSTTGTRYSLMGETYEAQSNPETRVNLEHGFFEDRNIRLVLEIRW
ncbi:hypothetical protein Ocin01_03231 [Orchesella cincta]|uniref:Uncharacterized protein n=1 Tax=Orchesella cincta TaxID=48709 RepID=A0A1D2NDX2_ORCCI|nr:hypothetical protein Ocin01_03231 [Orchesella cincta]